MQRLISISLLLFSVSVKAQLFETASGKTDSVDRSIDLNGYMRVSAYAFGNFYDYANAFAEFSLQATAKKGKAFFYTDLRFRTGSEFDEYQNTLEIKEAYAAYQTDIFELAVGEQIVTWGQADGFNPTDNITPKNYFFLSANPDDQKLPNLMLKANIYIGTRQNIELIAIPFYRASVYRFDLFDLGGFTHFTEAYQPGKEFKNGSLAAKWNFSFPGIDFSFSWFRGFDPYYGFELYNLEISPVDELELTLRTHPYLKNTLGTDLSVSLGSFILKGEFACNITDDYEQNIYIPNPDLYYVGGIELNSGGWNIIGQYIGKYIIDYAEQPLQNPENPFDAINIGLNEFNRKIFYQTEKFNHALSLNISKSFFYENLNTELSGYYNITTEEWLIRPKMAYALTDNLSVALGGFISGGPNNSLFDYNADIMNGIFLELKYNF